MNIKEMALFAAKVAAVILVINQVPTLSAIINKNYFSS